MHLRLSLPLILLLPTLSPAAPTAVADSPADTPNWPTPVVAPFLTPDDEIKSIHLPKGFHLELVAAEPQIAHPVTLSWDPDGRMYVAEMRSYMPDVAGTGENAPTGRITRLEDTDGDGRMDKATVFLDHLVLPRAVSVVQGGVLVATPPRLLFCQDTNHDGVSDTQTPIANDYGISGNPEHQPNGLLPGLDNWIYSANYDKRLRFLNGSWISDPTPELGQWGISQDNTGRLFHNSNTDQLRASLYPPHYADRNPHFRATGANEQIAHDQTVWPLHPTAVDRGYVRTLVRDDGSLLYFTAACAPCIYRGGLYGPEYDGNAFVCEPAGNLIKRNLLVPNPDGSLSAKNAYDGHEFLATTYERFRPVNLFTGPDGCLYVIDMHHGLLQHKVFLTTYCKDQYLARQLDKHLQTGRIFRIVPDNAKPFPQPHLSTATIQELIDTLHHPNGWWRDTAQRLLVERNDYKAVPPLRKMATTDDNPLARLHAAWTLEGLKALNPTFLTTLLSDSDARIRAAAVRLSEPFLASPTSRPKILPAILALTSDPSTDVRLQLALTLTPLGLPETDAALTTLLSHDPTPLLRDATLTGLRGRELDLLTRLLSSPSWQSPDPGRPALLQSLARAVLTEASPQHVATLLRTTASQPTESWQQLALLDGLQPPNGPKRRRRKNDPPPLHQITLPSQPTEFLSLLKSPSPAKPRASALGSDDNTPTLQDKLQSTLTLLHWPGQPGYTPPPPPKPLTAEQQALFEKGRNIYAQTCTACHKPDGLGQEGLAPPLRDSEWVLGPPSRPARIVLQGLTGPITVAGRSYSLDMPPLAKLSDEDLAAVLTFVRRTWDHTASPVDPSLLAKIRATPRPLPWTERELLKTP